MQLEQNKICQTTYAKQQLEFPIVCPPEMNFPACVLYNMYAGSLPATIFAFRIPPFGSSALIRKGQLATPLCPVYAYDPPSEMEMLMVLIENSVPILFFFRAQQLPQLQGIARLT